MIITASTLQLALQFSTSLIINTEKLVASNHPIMLYFYPPQLLEGTSIYLMQLSHGTLIFTPIRNHFQHFDSNSNRIMRLSPNIHHNRILMFQKSIIWINPIWHQHKILSQIIKKEMISIIITYDKWWTDPKCVPNLS